MGSRDQRFTNGSQGDQGAFEYTLSNACLLEIGLLDDFPERVLADDFTIFKFQ